jgi:hypothetical protein
MKNIKPALNIPVRHQKGLVKLFGGMAAPFYFTTNVVREGTPMKFTAVVDNIEPCVAGASDGAKCAGLAMQATYDDTLLAELQGYHFANNTKQRLSTNEPIGLLCGAGYALTTNWDPSVTIAYGDSVYIGPSGYLSNTGAAGDKLPAKFESRNDVNPLGTDGTGSGVGGIPYVRVRFDFPFSV